MLFIEWEIIEQEQIWKENIKNFYLGMLIWGCLLDILEQMLNMFLNMNLDFRGEFGVGDQKWNRRRVFNREY